ncbi:hypothetical protein Z043_115110 [Scleropages formosus]|uniref:Uncharacterized protein n=1 Tax=Scleropages formosus TaxID=113540 RepID=A0A0P7WXD5_SCLFO|nr:hypothetical protein Z043_115110 [Scleropages formosus]
MENNRHLQSEFVVMQGGPYEQLKQPEEMRTLVRPAATLTLRDHIVWSLCNFFYMNPCCLGLAALIYSIKVRKLG